MRHGASYPAKASWALSGARQLISSASRSSFSLVILVRPTSPIGQPPAPLIHRGAFIDAVEADARRLIAAHEESSAPGARLPSQRPGYTGDRQGQASAPW
jgi:hypothetical protein